VTTSGATDPRASTVAADDAGEPADDDARAWNAWRVAAARWGPVVVVCVPIVWAAIRAAAGGWVPLGDDAYFTVRARDVLTSHHPLLGAWSSGSVDLTTPINNLGPMQLDLLAPFTRFTPMGGTAIGVAVINIVAIVAIGWLVRRVAGDRAVLPAMCAVGLLTWTMGSEMLITPRQHQAMIIPYLCLLVAAWAVAAGDRWAVVVAVASASLVAQTHLSYPVLVGLLTVTMVGCQVVATRQGWVVGGRAPLVWGAGLAVVLWAQTLIDQFTGEGNLGHVLFGSGDAGRTGLNGGVRIVAATLVAPYTFLRPGYREFDKAARFGATWQVVVLVLAVAAAIAYVATGIRRRRLRDVTGVLVAVVAVLGGVLDASLLPRTRFGYIVMNYRWLWATGAFVLVLVFVAIGRRLEAHARDHRQRVVFGGLAVAILVVPAIANVPKSVQLQGASIYLGEQRNVELALTQVDGVLDGVAARGPVVIDDSAMYFGHGYTYPLLIMMQEHGVDFRFASAIQERRFGSGRVSDGTETQRLRMVSGDAALALRDDPHTVAFVEGDRPPVAFVLEPIDPAS
jgi:hypothetical protein